MAQLGVCKGGKLQSEVWNEGKLLYKNIVYNIFITVPVN